MGYGKLVKEKLEKVREDIMHFEEHEFDHMPKINKKSAKIINEKSGIMH